MTITEQRRDFTAGDHLELIVVGKAKDQRIRDLEREVERLKGEVDGWTSAEALQGWQADRADAERFRWWMRNRWTWGASNFPDAEIIARIDAAMAKDPQL